ncbi:MAG: hypothetical protein ABWW69_05495 [Pyrodictiaceae archaeon]
MRKKSMARRRLDEYLAKLGDAIRRNEVDLEATIKRIVELTLSMTLEGARAKGQLTDIEAIKLFSTKINEVISLLHEIKEGLDSIKEEYKGIAERLRRIEDHIKTLQPLRNKQPEWLLELEKMLSERGFILLSEDRKLISLVSKADKSILAANGIEVIELGRDMVIITHKALQKFFERLRGASKALDEEEAARLMGEFSSLFKILRREGLIIYSYKAGGWQPQDVLRKLYENYFGRG